MNTHFKIIISCRNVEKWIACCLLTLVKQRHINWKCIFVDDASTDRTFEIAKGFSTSDTFTFIHNKKRQPKISNYIRAIQIANPKNEDVLVFLDGDDCLSDIDVLSYLNIIYKKDIWVTWGNYTEISGRELIPFGNYRILPISKGPRPCPNSMDIRNGWRYSHLKTMKYFLWKNIKDTDFRHDISHKYLEAAIDTAIMWPAVEMARPNHIKYISRLMYIYNNSNLDSYMFTIPDMQKRIFQDLKKKDHYLQKTKEELL